jgi:hypothetical protein
MTGPKTLPEQETKAWVGTAQLVTLGSDAPAASKTSGIARNGADININIVVSLGEDKYLKSTLGGDVAAALLRELKAITGEGRVAFTTTWMSRVKVALYEEYQHVVSRDPKLTSFNYVVPPFTAPMEPKPNEFRPAAVTFPVIARTGEITRDTTLRQAPKPVTAQDVQLPKDVTGKGTKKAPYTVDLTGKSTATDSLGKIKLVMPAEFDIGLSSAVYITFVLTASQLRKMRDESPTDGPIINELRSITNTAMERSCKIQGEPYEGDTYYKAEDALKQLSRKLWSFTNMLKDKEVQTYFAK